MDDTLMEAWKNYDEAKWRLLKFEAPFKVEIRDSWLVVSCPDCGTVFWTGHHSLVPSFSYPVICCGKLRR